MELLINHKRHDEVECVLRWLSARDVIHVAQVNRQWRDVTRQSTVFARIELIMSNSGVCYGWGFDYHGQLAKVGLNKPKLISAFGSSIDSIHAGEQTSFISRKDGLYALGMNDHGRLGVKDHPYEAHEPVKVNSQLYKSISSREATYAIELTSGQLWSWGQAWNGQLGHGDFEYYRTPKVVQALKNKRIKQVDCGADFVVCLTEQGVVYTCGKKDMVGQGELETDVSIPTKLNGVGKIGSVACGWKHAILVSKDGNTLWSFGNNAYGELGRPGPCDRPLEIESMRNKHIVKVAAGFSCSVALTKTGTLFVWGNLGANEDVMMEPREIETKNGNKIVDMSIKHHHIMVLTESNKLFTWGRNRCGECGHGTYGDFIEKPKRVKGLEHVVIQQISAGDNHSLIKCTKKREL